MNEQHIHFGDIRAVGGWRQVFFFARTAMRWSRKVLTNDGEARIVARDLCGRGYVSSDVREIMEALHEAISALIAASPHIADNFTLPEHTGIAAGWCPECGDCTCPRDKNGEPKLRDDGDGWFQVIEDPLCPLHRRGGAHVVTALAMCGAA